MLMLFIAENINASSEWFEDFFEIFSSSTF